MHIVSKAASIKKLPWIMLRAVTARASRHGRPRPSGRRFSSNNGSMIAH
jgi:hypothetical protein